MSSKKCTTCGVEKPISEYGKHRGISKRCRTCAGKASKATRDRKVAWMRAIKMESGCVDCGYKKHPTALQFDHINDDKEFSPARGACYSKERVRAQMAKCEVVCANCHAIRTYRRHHGEELD